MWFSCVQFVSYALSSIASFYLNFEFILFVQLIVFSFQTQRWSLGSDYGDGGFQVFTSVAMKIRGVSQGAQREYFLEKITESEKRFRNSMFFIVEVGIKKRVVNKNGSYWSGTVWAKCLRWKIWWNIKAEGGWENVKVFQVLSKEHLIQ